MHHAPNRQSGQVIIGSLLLFLTISVTVLVGIATPVAYQIRTAADYLQSKQGYIAADVLNEESLYRLNKGRTLPANLILSFNGATSTALVTDVGGLKQVISTGISGAFTRISKSIFTQGEGVTINYGLQVGNGGVIMSGSSAINGNVISNGDITASGSCVITGSAVASTASVEVSDQSNGSGTPAINTTFGSSNSDQDIAQSFVVSTTTPVAKVMLYIKKTGSPANATIRIATDSFGSPSNTTLTSGTLVASQVTTTYGWVPIVVSTNISLTPGTTYWLVVDVASNGSSKTYQLGTSNTSSYTSGSMKTGRYDSSWTALNSAYDGFFRVYLGDTSTISGVIINGNANGYTVNNSTVAGNLYCQSGTGNNKSCNTSSSTPLATTFPFSDNNIAEWKADASAGIIYNGNFAVANDSATTTTGALKINGNLDLTSSARMTLGGPLYVTGNLTISGSANLNLSSSYGSQSEIVIVDGTISLAASGAVSGSGSSGSYVVFLSTSSCGGLSTCAGGASAIAVSGGAGAVVLFAPNGAVNFSGSASAKAIASYKMIMSGSAVVNYESGLADIDFTSGPSGSWLTDTWQEIYQ